MPTKMRALPGGGWATGYTEGNLALVPLLWDGWDAGIHEGEEDPIEGWLPLNAKPEFVPAPVYKATRTATKAPADWHGTLLLPFRAADPPRVTVRRHEVGPIGFACEIETDAWRDLFFLSNSFEPRTYRLGEIETDCPLCHIRFVDGRPVSGMTCDGNFLRIGRKPVFEQGGAVLAREYDFTVDPPRITTAHPRQRHR